MTTAVDTALVRELGDAAARHVPAAEDLRVLGVEEGAQTERFAGAAAAELGDGTAIVLCAGEDLVTALATSPLGNLSLAAALQPAFDAVGSAAGSVVGAARDVMVEELPGVLGESVVTVLLGADDVTAALIVPRPGTASAAAVPEAATVSAAEAVAPARGIEMLHGVVMDVTVEIGRTRMPVRDLLSLAPGAVIELDRAAGSPADLLVNGRLIARGEVVVVDEDFALRITEIVDPSVTS